VRIRHGDQAEREAEREEDEHGDRGGHGEHHGRLAVVAPIVVAL
jgi:hypothetical protein